jgi:hypothetical protein
MLWHKQKHLTGFITSVCRIFSQDHAAVYQWSTELHTLLHNLRMADHIFMKFGIKFVPLEATPNPHLLQWIIPMRQMLNHEVGR